jgi:regulator of protease activity HflC (stomatin/prohibitin superfamily)
VILERFGKFSAIQKHGLNFKFPILDTIKFLPEWGQEANKNGFMIELSEQQSDTRKRQCQTRDNVTVNADAVVYWRITDPGRAVYNVDVLPKSVRDTALNALRANIGTFTLDELLSQRQALNERIAAQLSEISQKWGIVFTRVEVQEIEYDKNTQDAMLQQMAAERKKRAQIAEAEGESQAITMKAKANAEAAILEAQGRAKALEISAMAESVYITHLSKSLDVNRANQLLLVQKTLVGFDIISKNQAHTVFVPNSTTGIMLNIPNA